MSLEHPHIFFNARTPLLETDKIDAKATDRLSKADVPNLFFDYWMVEILDDLI